MESLPLFAYVNGFLNEPDLVDGKKRNLVFFPPLSLDICSVKSFFAYLDEIANSFYIFFKHCQSIKSLVEHNIKTPNFQPFETLPFF